MSDHYILNDNGEPEAIDVWPGGVMDAEALNRWGAMYENTAARIVKQEEIGDYMISTVFLGLDHNFSKQGPPILWETMVFSAHPNAPRGLDREMDRCAGGRKQAEAMHQRMRERVEAVIALSIPSHKHQHQPNE